MKHGTSLLTQKNSITRPFPALTSPPFKAGKGVDVVKLYEKIVAKYVEMEGLTIFTQLEPSTFEGFQPETAWLGWENITDCCFVFHN